MSDLSLRQYLNKVETLLEGGHLEEAKAHARHILSYYPKNRHAYLLLGRVLVAQRRWEEAAEVLRRLLGADPLNAMAHQLLSQAYAQLFQLENALFHLERALDQNPNDRQIIASLRELYSRTRGEKVEKIQLTAGAVATQYLSNSLPDQAADILKKASTRFPERIDLKLMLALAYKANEQHIEAAEAAVDVLKSLPFAVQANRIVAEFWLAQQRPSDARLNIARIEEVDPYLAQQIVTGSVDEQRYTLPELDYKRLVERELTATNPDWLKTLGGAAAATTSTEAFSDDLAWLLDDMTNQTADANATPDPAQGAMSAAPSPSAASLGDLDLSNDWLEQVAAEGEPSSASRTSTGLTGLLVSLGAGGEDETWMRDVLSGGGPTEPVATQTPDNLDFLADIGVQPPISPQSGRVSTGFTDFITPVEAPPASPMDSDASLEAFFNQIESIEDPLDLANSAESFFDQLEYAESEEDSAVIAPNTVSTLGDEPAANDESDPLAWMREAGIEIDEAAQNPFEAAAALDESGLMAPTEMPEDPLAWARQSNVEVVADPDEDPLAWMRDMGIEEAAPSLPSDQHAEREPSFDIQPSSNEEMSNYLQAQAAGEGPTTMSNDPNWQDNLDDFSWLEEPESAEADALSQANNAEALDWLSDPALPEASTGFTSMLDRLDQTDPAQDDLFWMDKFNTNYLEGDAASTAANQFGFEDESFANFNFDEAPKADTPETSKPEEPDWLNTIGAASDQSFGDDVATWDEEPVAEFSTGEESAEDEFNFKATADHTEDSFSFDTGRFESFEQPAEPTMASDFGFAQEGASDEFGFSESELEAFGFPEAEQPAEPTMASDFGFAQEGASDEFGFSESELEAFGFPEAEQPAEPTMASDFGFAQETHEGAMFDEEAIATSDFNFMVGGGNLVTEHFDEALASDETMQDFGFNTEQFSDFALDEEPQPTSAEMAEFDFGDFDSVPEADEERVDWFNQEQSILNAEDEPDWLNAIQFGGETNEAGFALEEEAQEAFEEGFAVASAPIHEIPEDYDAQAEPVYEDIASNAPDWLNSMVPGLDVDYENLPTDDFIEEEFVLDEAPSRLEGFDAVNDGYDWLDELVEEETSNMLPVSPAPVPLPPVPEFSQVAQAAPAPTRAVPPTTRSFVFAAPPPWLARLREMISGKRTAEEDEFADFDFDDDDLK